MTSRSGWLLLGIVVGMPCLPGCFPLRARSDGSDGVRRIDAPPADVARGKLPPTEEPAVAKTGDSAYPSVLAVSPQPDDAKLEPPTPTLQGPVSTGTVDPQELTGQAPANPPAVEPKPPAEPPMKLEPFVAALQCILDGRHQDALKHLQAYDPQTQEFYLRHLPMLTILARKRIDQLSVPEVAVLNDQLQNLLIALRPRTELGIDRMCYCESLSFKAFGVYQPLPDSHAFVAPSGDRRGEQVSLYVEVRNVASVPRGNGFETRLASTIEILDAEGRRVRLLNFKETEKPARSLSRLNDYCNVYTFPVPSLPPGSYQLLLHIADETNPDAPRVAHKTLEFRVSPIGARVN